MDARRVAVWVAAALLGLAIAVGVGIVTTRLVSQPVGLTSDTPAAGDGLAPAPRR